MQERDTQKIFVKNLGAKYSLLLISLHKNSGTKLFQEPAQRDIEA
jgi:hypothetical protein